jgi:hypothetical protein
VKPNLPPRSREVGHDRATLQEFFDLLGAERAAKIRLVSADAAEWIGDCALALARVRAIPSFGALATIGGWIASASPG